MPRLKKTAVSALALAAFLMAAPVASGTAFAASDPNPAPAPTTDGKDKKEGKALQDINDLLKNGGFEPALARLAGYTAANPTDADGWNLMGYASRKLGNFDRAFGYYEKALALNPNHLGALEYMGELYVQMGQLDTAKGLLARLQGLCPQGCSQVAQLEAFIQGGSETASRAW